MSETIGHTGGKHHPETVWEHMMMVGDGISPKFPLTRLAGFLHDIGKPESFLENEGKRFGGHDKTGAKIAKEILIGLKFSNKEIDHIISLIGCHMRLAKDSMSAKARRKTFAKFAEKNVNWRDFVRLRISDSCGNLNVEKKESFESIRSMTRTFTVEMEESSVFGLKDLSVSGGELIEHFDLEPGPVVGIAHRKLLEFVLENGEEFNTKEELLKEAEKILAKENIS